LIPYEDFVELIFLADLRRQVQEQEPRFNELVDKLMESLEDRDRKVLSVHGHEVRLSTGDYQIDWKRVFVDRFGSKAAKAEEKRHLRLPIVIVDGIRLL
jgi:hypothetical protein